MAPTDKPGPSRTARDDGDDGARTRRGLAPAREAPAGEAVSDGTAGAERGGGEAGDGDAARDAASTIPSPAPGPAARLASSAYASPAPASPRSASTSASSQATVPGNPAAARGAAPRGQRPASRTEDAFAQTIAPTTDGPFPAPSLGAAFDATIAPSSLPHLSAEATPSAGRTHRGQAPARIRAASLPVAADAMRTADDLGASDEDLPGLPQVEPHHYRTDAEVARGGMGRITAAFDHRLGRKVALKELLEPAGEQLARFHREALVTARLQHPSIVPVYEAGQWPTGEPFFAMKLVSGRPLDKVIAETKTLAERIALLPRIVAASDAIAYAHSQRIIHRDLKPGNILIGEYGETVVIDWGLAKDLDLEESAPGTSTLRVRGGRHEENVQLAFSAISPVAAGAKADAQPAPGAESAAETSDKPRAMGTGPSIGRSVVPAGSSTLTVAGAVMGTPAYMAPEQARGEVIDERSDVFALGAMLYHTLAGRPPYDAKTATDVITAAADGHVVPLRQRDPHIPLELVAIVERAMAQQVAKRYPSAKELAEELRRFMTGQLVGAHHYTAWERTRRYVRKHRAAVTIAAVAVLGFALGGTFAVRRIVVERDRAEEQRVLAVTRKAAAEKLVDFMLSDLRRRLAAIGRADLLTGMGTEVRRYYEQLASSPDSMPPDDVDRMAAALAIIAFAEGQAGSLDAALATWDQAKKRLAASLERSPAGPSAFSRKRALARAELELGYLTQQRGKLGAAGDQYRESLRQLALLLASEPDDRDALLLAATAHDRLADLLRNSGKVDESFDEYAIGRQQRERVVSRRRDDRDAIYALSTSHARLGTVYEARGESAQALVEYHVAARQRDSLLEIEPDNVEWQAGMVQVQTEIAALHRDLGDLTAAIATYQDTIPLAETLLRRDPSNTAWRRDRGNLLADFGFSLMAAGNYADALTRFEQALHNHRDLVAVDPANTAWQADLSRFSTRAGDALQYLGRMEEALARFDEARALRAELSARDPKNVPWKRSLAWANAKLAVFYTVRGDPALAIAAHEQALTLRKELVAGSKSHAGLRDELASTEVALGKQLLARDLPRAAELIEDGQRLAKALHEGDPLDNTYKETYASALLAAAELGRARGDRAAARAALTSALAVAQTAMARAGQSATWPAFAADLHIRLAELLAADGKRADSLGHWFAARDLLERLAATGRISFERKPLLLRARAQTAGAARPASGATSPPSPALDSPAPPPSSPGAPAVPSPAPRSAPARAPSSPPGPPASADPEQRARIRTRALDRGVDRTFVHPVDPPLTPLSPAEPSDLPDPDLGPPQ
jgi:serine/threonine protein kinase